ncbi:MAG: hypothetical protein CO129_00295 [Ignavibacteriales bacterium CG_4_9_14_3_um_filter_34_10]|nr:MAG: hypothetical protein CO129_00295 [Ignavibacteriales bacterium CG_4_9_14_3_um_filter_34_10]
MKKNIKYSYLIAAVVLISALFAGYIGSNGNSKKVIIHLVSNVKKADGPVCVAFDVALVNLKLGNKVEFLFDADAAWNLKFTKGKNDFDRYEVPADLKKLVSEQVKDKSLLSVKNFEDFLKLLHDKGATISVNGTWNVLTSVEKEVKGKRNIPNYIEPITLQELASRINNADVYYSY